MKNKKIEPFNNLKLDPYEQEIHDAIERGEYIQVKNELEEKSRLTKIFRDTVRKDRRISIRVNNNDLASIKKRATKNMLPYQTLISTILHRFATGKIKIEL